jgi:hypothetical protein
MNRTSLHFAIIPLLIFGIPMLARAHEGELDTYGCHYHKERKDYHCHEGMFKGGSFDSRIEMLQRLKRQFIELGRPWPYGDIDEEDITASQPQQEPEK